MTDLDFEYCSIDTLIPYCNNARTHSDEQVAQLAGSMAEFGCPNPALFDGEDCMIAGHGRLTVM
ncbi:MAG: ParB-like chromosome segregation protein Spo0J [Gammaproteobacteria bacterium]|jgi:ParB-like chromosome segregation protein Spo0J